MTKDTDALREAIEGIDDDYMTSEKHHPGYVLIPTVKFEQMVAAAKRAKEIVPPYYVNWHHAANKALATPDTIGTHFWNGGGLDPVETLAQRQAREVMMPQSGSALAQPPFGQAYGMATKPVDPVAGGEALREVVAKIIADFTGQHQWDDMASDRAQLREFARVGRYDLNEPTKDDCLEAADRILAALKGPASRMTDQPKQDAIVTQRAREAAASMLSAEGMKSPAMFSNIRAGFVDDLRIVQAFHRFEAEIEAATIERCVGVADSNRTDDDSMWDRAADTIATALRNLKGQTS